MKKELMSYVLMPSGLTAENGAKGLLSGEFYEYITLDCSECQECGVDEDCDVCRGAGKYQQPVAVSWTTIKNIYALAVGNLSHNPRTTKPENIDIYGRAQGSPRGNFNDHG